MKHLLSTYFKLATKLVCYIHYYYSPKYSHETGHAIIPIHRLRNLGEEKEPIQSHLMGVLLETSIAQLSLNCLTGQ